MDLSEYDLVYTIKANATVIEGASAGAALAVATVAALTGKELNSSVMMTGTINHDGTIGPVGGIFEKAIGLPLTWIYLSFSIRSITMSLCIV